MIWKNSLYIYSIKKFFFLSIILILTRCFCLFLQIHMNVSAVLASITTGFICFFIPEHKFYSHVCTQKVELQQVIYTASFLAMTSSMDLSFDLLFPTFILSIVFMSFKKYFHGHGGKLGTIAFLSASLYLLVMGSL